MFHSPDCPLFHTLTLRQPEYSGSCIRRAQRLLDTWLDTTARLLPRVSAGVASAHLLPPLEPLAPGGCLGYPSLPGWVAALTPAALQALHLDFGGGACRADDVWEGLGEVALPAAAISGLPRLMSLTRLDLTCWQLPSCTPGVLESMHEQLAGLRICTGQLSAPLMEAILKLCCLRSLALRASR